MPNPLYNSVDYTATIKKTREFLADYHMWHVEAAHFSSWVKSPSNFGTPSYHSTENTVENRVVDQANAQFECELRTKTLEQLATVDNESALLSDLLLFRWINNWSVKKTCTELAVFLFQNEHTLIIYKRHFWNSPLFVLESCSFKNLSPPFSNNY